MSASRKATFRSCPISPTTQINAQVEYCLGTGWAVSVEFTDDPHPRNTYWELWGLPMFDLQATPAAVLYEVAECRQRVWRPLRAAVAAFDSVAGLGEPGRISFLRRRGDGLARRRISTARLFSRRAPWRAPGRPGCVVLDSGLKDLGPPRWVMALGGAAVRLKQQPPEKPLDSVADAASGRMTSSYEATQGQDASARRLDRARARGPETSRAVGRSTGRACSTKLGTLVHTLKPM